MNIIMPLAGEGKRFAEAGFPEKPFVDMNGKPLIRRVLESLPKPWREQCNFTFVTKKEYTSKLRNIIKELGLSYQFIETGPTKGAASSVLLAKQTTDANESLVILNGDQLVKFSLHNFNTLAHIVKQQTQNLAETGGVVPVFQAGDRKWSFVELDKYDKVVRVAEKEVISKWATCGIYFWSSAGKFFECAENMIFNERKVNNEFYVAPVYNEVVRYGFKTGSVYALEIEKMVSLGTPEDVKECLEQKTY